MTMGVKHFTEPLSKFERAEIKREQQAWRAMEKRIAELEALAAEWRDWYRACNREHMYARESLPGRTDAALSK